MPTDTTAAPSEATTERKRYVCGFALCENSDVLLIEKQRPEWQRGFWNGVGGGIEPGESDVDAMEREFREETGIAASGWEHFATLVTDHGSEVVFYRARIYPSPPVQTTDEVPRWFKVSDLPATIPNLRWLVPMALHATPENGMPFHISESGARLAASQEDAERERAEDIVREHELWHAGELLSNCAFNLTNITALDQRTRDQLDQCRREWDGIVGQYRGVADGAAYRKARQLLLATPTDGGPHA